MTLIEALLQTQAVIREAYVNQDRFGLHNYICVAMPSGYDRNCDEHMGAEFLRHAGRGDLATMDGYVAHCVQNYPTDMLKLALVTEHLRLDWLERSIALQAFAPLPDPDEVRKLWSEI